MGGVLSWDWTSYVKSPLLLRTSHFMFFLCWKKKKICSTLSRLPCHAFDNHFSSCLSVCLFVCLFLPLSFFYLSAFFCLLLSMYGYVWSLSFFLFTYQPFYISISLYVSSCVYVSISNLSLYLSFFLSLRLFLFFLLDNLLFWSKVLSNLINFIINY